MNKQKAKEILKQSRYPTDETIRAFAVVYPALFWKTIKEIKNEGV